jgi:prephenate dehydrogenase
MKICVVGLGLIGGSLCMSLKRAGYKVCGNNRSPKAVEYALKNNIIDEYVTEFTDCDVVFVALPPKATVNFINSTKFKNGAIVSDICGVKRYIENEVYKIKRNFYYVGCHPMAGKEVSGIENATETLFDRASMIITSDTRTNSGALEIIEKLTKDMGFARIVECSSSVHDGKIAYTSQLAHVVSNAYVKDSEIAGCLGFTGGSFQDMTRIAGVDEGVWSSLFIKNADYLSQKVGALISSLEEIKEAIDGGDEQKLASVLREGRICYENHKKISPNSDIIVKKLK